MNIACPECRTIYRLDPARIPDAGVRTRCRECDAQFVARAEPDAQRPGHVVSGQSAEPVDATPSPEATSAQARPPAFGPQDPQTRARRLARALVSDIKVYHPEKWARSREAGTLRQEFRTEILKSWEEYVEQVGEEMARKTPYFRDALNDILAEGKAVF